jgi:hypothetical protein
MLDSSRQVVVNGAGERLRRTSASVVVFKTNDVVFSKIRARLDLYELDRYITVIFATMRLFYSNVNALTHGELMRDTVEDDGGVSIHDEPVLGALGVTLVAQALTWRYHDEFYLEVWRFVV